MFDFLIVGQGIAGSVMAITLIEKGYTVCVIDKPDLSLSSKIAAGIWNPVVFKRLVKSWLADDVVPELERFYLNFENKRHSSFVFHRHIIKPFTEIQEQQLWLKKAQYENLFLDKSIYENLKISVNNSIDTYSKVLSAGNIDLTVFLNETKNYLKEHSAFLEEKLEHEQLIITEDKITYKSIEAKQIIFCEGYLISGNPLFKYIHLKPAKGEILTIECKDLKLTDDILNKGIFILPLGDHQFKVGATYEWLQLNDMPTNEKKFDLESKLQTILDVPYTIIKHEAGVRPAVIDRRPVIGNHPLYKNCFVFNGFGTKAVMLAPYFANQFYELIKLGKPMHSEVDSNRFNKFLGSDKN